MYNYRNISTIALNALNNDYVLAVLSILATSYIAMSRVYLPEYIIKLFKSDWFRVLFLSLLLIIRFEKAPHVALIVALVFVASLDYIDRKETFENFVEIKKQN